MQRTFGESFALDSVVPTRPHPDDVVDCSDGTTIARSDAWFDVDGQAHRTEEECRDANVEIVRGILKAHEKWCDDYTSGAHNNDYGDGYAYIAQEASHEWGDSIDEWLNDCAPELATSDFADELVELIADDIWDWESEYNPSEYARYSGPGICLFSLEVGEYEEEIDVSADDRLRQLHEVGDLEGILGELDGEFCLCNTYHHDYDVYVHGGWFTVIFNPGGQWHYVVPDDESKRLLAEAICHICRKRDAR